MTTVGLYALPVNPAALAQRVAKQLHDHDRDERRVILVSAAPVWPYDPVLTAPDGTRMRVVPCVSVLAVWEQLSVEHDLACVVLTDLPHQDLGPGILSRVFRRRLVGMEPWGLVAEAFGAQRHDPRLEAYAWAGPALIDATPSGGWPPVAGPVLERDVALRHLAAARLGLDRIGIGADNMDVQALLRWSLLPAAPEAFSSLSDAEREGLLSWLGIQFGPTTTVLGALLAQGKAGLALPLGVVCEALWAADDPASVRAQGRVDQYLGAIHLDDTAMRSFAAAAASTLLELVEVARTRNADAAGARQLSRQVLDGAEDLLLGFAALEAARHSRTLRSGFEYGLGAVAEALTVAMRGARDLRPAVAAVAQLAAHHLAPDHQHRVDRAKMALRLLRWLALEPAEGNGVADFIDRQVNQWAYVDVALGHVWAGEDTHDGLAAVYRAVHDLVRDRRRELDRAFAGTLAAWTRDGAQTTDQLTVETILSRVVAPLLRDGGRPVLVIVIDGMSAAVAADLAHDATDQGWVEYDPLSAGAPSARRRGAVAALPTVTAVSRTSLLAGTLRRGNQDDERVAFEQHRLWRGRTARLFHKGTVAGSAGKALNDDLVLALSEPDTVVGVVLNVVDDSLDHGRQSADPSWQIADVGALRALLDHARYHGRAVILVSDHGHVHERDGVTVPAGVPESARHRTDLAPPGEAEVELIGARVVAGEERIVALWDPQARYLPRRAGYHGGASLAEVTTPVLALLHFGAAAPAGWRPLGPYVPAWWSPEPESDVDIPTETARAQRKPRKQVALPDDSALFDIPALPSLPSPPASLVDAVLASDTFAAQHASTPRRVPLSKVEGALRALVDANGVLATVLVAERAGEQPARAVGLVTTLQRIFNVDNFAVLSVEDDSRTVRLNVTLLRQQFLANKAPS